MLKSFNIALFVFSINCIVAQSNDSLNKKWAIGIFGSFDNAYRSIENTNPNDEITNFIFSNRNETEISKFSFSVGFSAQRKLSKNITLEISPSFSNKGYKTRLQEFNYQPLGTYPSSVFFKYNFYHIDLPVSTLFSIIKINKHCISLKPSIMPSFYFKKNIQYSLNYPNSKTEKKDNYYNVSQYSTFTNISIVYSYYFAKNYFISIAPNFKYCLFPNDNNPIKERLYSYCVDFSVYRKF